MAETSIEWTDKTWNPADDCAREGFPELTPAEFCAFYRRQA